MDVLLLLWSRTDGITPLRQMKEQGLKLPYIHGWKGSGLQTEPKVKKGYLSLYSRLASSADEGAIIKHRF